MKMTEQDYGRLLDGLREVVERVGLDGLADYRESLKDDERVKDLNKRFRWDIWSAVEHGQKYSVIASVYRYASDSHLDTGIRKALRELGVDGTQN